MSIKMVISWDSLPSSKVCHSTQWSHAKESLWRKWANIWSHTYDVSLMLLMHREGLWHSPCFLVTVTICKHSYVNVHVTLAMELECCVRADRQNTHSPSVTSTGREEESCASALMERYTQKWWGLSNILFWTVALHASPNKSIPSHIRAYVITNRVMHT